MTKMRMAVLAILSLTLAATALAQFTQRSGISGLVTDQAGAVIPGVTVTLTDLDRNQVHTTTANESGAYSFPNLTASRYRVSVEKEGFKKGLSDIIALGAQESLRVDLQLQLGEVTETVEVTAAAPLLRTEQTAVGETVERELIEQLPILGRNFTTFSALAPNVSTYSRGNSSESWAVGSHYTIGNEVVLGGGGGYSGIFMNGVDINDIYEGGTSYMPSSEAVSEVKVDVANFSAANGRDVTSTTVQTRGGTNLLHGTGFDYFQNSALNAWNSFDKSQILPETKKPLMQRNQFGGNLGGPIYIPKLFNGKDKAFFFFNYEGGLENHGSDPIYARMPTAAERQGDFSSWLTRFPGDANYVLYDPNSTTIDADGNSHRTAVPNNDLRNVAGGLNQDVLKMLEAYPLPNGYQDPNNPNSLTNFFTTSSHSSYNYRMDMRFDYKPTQKDSVYSTYSRSHGSANRTGGIFPDIQEAVEESSYVTTINYARVFTSSLTNEFVVGWGNTNLTNLPQSTLDYMGRTDTLFNQYLNNLGSPVDLGYHAIVVGNYSGYGDVPGYEPVDNSLPNWGFEEVLRFHTPSFQLSDSVNWIKGRHSMNMGFSYIMKGNWVWTADRAAYFDRRFTQAGSGDPNPQLGGDPLADFVLGLPSTMLQPYAFENNEVANFDMRMPVWAFYFQDKWQLTPKLTLTLGLRYDLPLMVYSKNNFGAATMDFSYPGWQLKIPGRAEGLPQKYLNADKNNFAPRFGLAYRLTNDLVVRASYGVFYLDGIQEYLPRSQQNVAGGGVFFNNAKVGVHDDVPYFHFGDVFPPQTQLKLGTYPVSTGEGTGYYADGWDSVNYLDQNSMLTPYLQRYMLEVEKGLGGNAAITFSYLGSNGRKGNYWQNLNAGPYQTGWASADDYNNSRPNNIGRWSDVWALRQGFNSFYNAATIKFEKRLSHGLQVLSHYTFSKTVADPFISTPEWAGVEGYSSGIQYDWHRYLARAESGFSHPHRWVNMVTYQTPWGKNWPGIAKTTLAGWNISFVTNFESGDALTVTNGVSDARDFEPNLPNLVGNPNLARGDRTPTHFFNTSAFADPGQDIKGNAGRNIVRGPGQNNWNISINKAFQPKEKFKAELRADLFNFFNHTQFGGIDTTLSTASNNTFGWVTWARDARVVTLGLRLSF